MILAGDPLHWPGAPSAPAAVVNIAAAIQESPAPVPLDAVLARREFLLAEGAASRREQAEAAARPRRYRLASAEDGRCLHCGSPMPQPSTRRRGRQPVTCSRECSTARKRDRDAARRRDDRAREATVPRDPGDGYGSVKVADADDVEAGLYEAGGFTVYRPRAG